MRLVHILFVNLMTKHKYGTNRERNMIFKAVQKLKKV